REPGQWSQEPKQLRREPGQWPQEPKQLRREPGQWPREPKQLRREPGQWPQGPDQSRRGLPTLPSLVVGTVSHTRRTPLRHAFTNRQYQWLVDVDDLPRHGWPLRALTRIEARDHLDEGRLGGGIRGDVERFLARRGVT